MRPMHTLWCVSVASMAPETLCAQEVADDWQFAAAIYAWLPDIDGHTTLPAGTGSVDVDLSAILDHLEMTGMGAFVIQKGNWGAFTDLVYVNVGGSHSQTRQLEIGGNPLPAGVAANLNFDLKAAVWTLAGSYRAVASEQSRFDFFAGARLASLKQELDWEFTGAFGAVTPLPRTGSRDVSVDLWDAIVGAKGQFRLGAEHKWLVPYYMDVGTGDSDVTWQAEIGVGYAFGWGDIDLLWRYLGYDLKSSPAIEDMSFNGPAIGAMFRW